MLEDLTLIIWRRLALENSESSAHGQPTLAGLHGRSYIIVYVCREN